ncbi:hypothetical protein U9M48_041180 [Paspalum notatum var. saurae]|uniref:Uncharacterized protein n=1 Tax=Paspalum notatum var. saurae TaxID=547442 RepID=A0AAQ3XGA0_PASNO
MQAVFFGLFPRCSLTDEHLTIALLWVLDSSLTSGSSVPLSPNSTLSQPACYPIYVIINVLHYLSAYGSTRLPAWPVRAAGSVSVTVPKQFTAESLKHVLLGIGKELESARHLAIASAFLHMERPLCSSHTGETLPFYS